MPEESPQKIIGLPETVLVLMIVGIEELFEAFILVITLGAGIIITEIMNAAMAALIEMYMLLRGGKGVKKLIVTPVCAMIDAATGGFAPGKFIGLAMGIWMINRPEKFGALESVASTKKMATGSVAGAVRT
ncbi:hypothetical protein A2372_00465 [Candidatus Wolfebacteria bacterium RIFOXYB1_FULL_54_12]|uniref:Uncharacterized protein n=1 Tax=Candidatus Wolfebacteria bacterium RIFOXYB1_FULL_54_12 TaxID=1802559 RepID=A0A1F8DVM1_9BACT|nr:MAG: hypothetical protein A2372_00465 [Candidatus Wolfebacteria bacterium RIFOXYB1_FULL_54_12]